MSAALARLHLIVGERRWLEQVFAGFALLAVATALALWLARPERSGLVWAAAAGALLTALVWAHQVRRDARALAELTAAASRLRRDDASAELPLIETSSALRACSESLRQLHGSLRRRLDDLHAREAAAQARLDAARESQDAVSQALFAAYVQAGALAREVDDGPAIDARRWREQVQTLERQHRGALAEMRLLSHELRPDALRSASLSELLQHAIDALEARCPGLVVHRRLQLDDGLAGPQRVQVYRFALLAMTRIARQGLATEVSIEWSATATSAPRLSIADDGEAIDPRGATAAQLRAHALQFGASLHFRREPAGGTELALELPA